jgi:CRP/FNR family cyclic AMP-dependent transcriptional regulator
MNYTLRDFAQQYPLVPFKAKEFLIRSGEKVPYFFFIKEGCVKMFSTSQNGSNLTLNIFYPNSCLSLMSLVGSAESAYDFQALTDGEAYHIPAEECITFVKSNAQVSYELLEKLLLGTHGLLFRIQQSSFVTAYYQVAGLLLYFARHSSQDDTAAARLSLRITHQDIADWLGLSRENVSVQMKKLERDGYISRVGKNIVVKNKDHLTQLVTNTALF